MTKKTARISDIAKRAGVSPATVSLVLNNRKGISTAVVERVRQIAFEMGYQKGIRPQQTYYATTQVCILQIRKSGESIEVGNTDSYASAILDYAASLPIQQAVRIEIRNTDWDLLGIEKAISSAFTNFDTGTITLENPESDRKAKRAPRKGAKKERSPEKQVLSSQKAPVNGLLIIATELSAQDISRLAASVALPSVFVDAPYPELPYDSVHINNIHIAYELVAHLREQGFQRLAYIGSQPLSANYRSRLEALQTAVQHSESPLHLEPVYSGEPLDNLLQQNGQPGFPDAFICHSDIQAYSLIKALGERGLRVSEDVGVVGFEDLPSSAFFSPPLSSVLVPRREMGVRAFQRLLEKMYSDNQREKGGCTPVSQAVLGRLIARESSLRSQNG